MDTTRPGRDSTSGSASRAADDSAERPRDAAVRAPPDRVAARSDTAAVPAAGFAPSRARRARRETSVRRCRVRTSQRRRTSQSRPPVWTLTSVRAAIVSRTTNQGNATYIAITTAMAAAAATTRSSCARGITNSRPLCSSPEIERELPAEHGARHRGRQIERIRVHREPPLAASRDVPRQRVGKERSNQDDQHHPAFRAGTTHRNIPTIESHDSTVLAPGIQPSSPVHLTLNGWTNSPVIAVSNAVIGRA